MTYIVFIIAEIIIIKHEFNYYYSCSCQIMNTRENFQSVYCFVTNQMRDETAKGNRQIAAWINHDLTRNNKLAFSAMTNLQFYRFSNTEIALFLFQLMYKQRIDMNDILRKSNVEFSRQDHTQIDSVSERRKIVRSSQFLFGAVQRFSNFTS